MTPNTRKAARQLLTSIEDETVKPSEVSRFLCKHLDDALNALDAAEARAERAERDIGYYKWKLGLVIPLMEEARDALPAISVTAAKLHHVRLDLADRMDVAGTAGQTEYDKQVAAVTAAEIRNRQKQGDQHDTRET